jgi:hypothetical protein
MSLVFKLWPTRKPQMKEENKKLAPPFYKMSMNDKRKKNLAQTIFHDLKKNKLCEPLNIKRDYLIWLVEAFVD